MPKPKGYLRRRGWKDLIFLAVVLTLGYSGKHYLLDSDAYGLNPVDDLRKWKRRPQLSPGRDSVSQAKPGQSGMFPCFFIVPPGAVDQPVVSGSVDHCRLLIPDGRQLDLFEVVLGGNFFPIQTDLYVPDVIPLAFTRTYRPIDDWAKRNRICFGHVYDLYLWGHRQPYTDLTWFLPDGVEIFYRRVSPGTGYADAVFEGTRRVLSLRDHG
jgi:hypothetical protein